MDCWESKTCGREQGGAKVLDSFAEKLANCMSCAFYPGPDCDRNWRGPL